MEGSAVAHRTRRAAKERAALIIQGNMQPQLPGGEMSQFNQVQNYSAATPRPSVYETSYMNSSQQSEREEVGCTGILMSAESGKGTNHPSHPYFLRQRPGRQIYPADHSAASSSSSIAFSQYDVGDMGNSLRSRPSRSRRLHAASLKPNLTPASKIASQRPAQLVGATKSNMLEAPGLGCYFTPQYEPVENEIQGPPNGESYDMELDLWNGSGRRQPLYKTEFCRSWEETGICRYGTKCQFAHSLTELRSVYRHPKYKTEICRTFHEQGWCPYGRRCCFIHNELSQKEKAQLLLSHHQDVEINNQGPLSGGTSFINAAPPTPHPTPRCSYLFDQASIPEIKSGGDSMYPAGQCKPARLRTKLDLMDGGLCQPASNACDWQRSTDSNSSHDTAIDILSRPLMNVELNCNFHGPQAMPYPHHGTGSIFQGPKHVDWNSDTTTYGGMTQYNEHQSTLYYAQQNSQSTLANAAPLDAESGLISSKRTLFHTPPTPSPYTPMFETNYPENLFPEENPKLESCGQHVFSPISPVSCAMEPNRFASNLPSYTPFNSPFRLDLGSPLMQSRRRLFY
jgi:hypothetical protein